MKSKKEMYSSKKAYVRLIVDNEKIKTKTNEIYLEMEN